MADNKCDNCPAFNRKSLKKLGIDLDNTDYVVALAGNPNTGKSTVFNSLTGLRQHTGNWPGKTVARAEGAFSLNGKKYKIVDLPGTYSLLSASTDEEIARNFILFGQPDVTIVVVDATRLERNLNLTIQILEITDKAILCVNLMDEARRNKIDIDSRSLSRELGIPVILASARQGEGIPELLKSVEDVVTGRFICNPFRLKNISSELNYAIEKLEKMLIAEFPGMPNTRWVALRLLEGDQQIIDSIKNGEISSVIKQQIMPETKVEN